MAAILELTFTGVGVADETLDYTGGGDVFTWKATRYKNNFVSIESDIAGQVEAFANAFQIDYNLDREYTLTTDATTVTIEHPTNTHFDSFVDATHNNTSFITTATSTTTEVVPLTVTATYSAHTTDKCNYVACNILFNQTINGLRVEQWVSGLGGVSIYNNASFDNTTIDVVLDRSKTRLHIYTTIDGFSEVFTLKISPKKLEIDNIAVEENIYGGNAEINVLTGMVGESGNTFAVTKTLLETPVFQSSNAFHALTPGTYYAHAKDVYGCQRTENFEISADAISYAVVPLDIAVSGKVSVPMMARDLPSTALVANQFNFLAEETPDLVRVRGFKIPYAESQSFQIQWKSSYPSHQFILSDCSNSLLDQSLTVVKRTDNIDRDTYLEGDVYWNSDYSRLAVSFTPGNKYDSSGNIIGTHTYNNELPPFYDVGIYLRINNEVVRIIDIIEDTGVEYAITDSTTNSPETGATIHSIHVAQPYEVYDVTVSMDDIPGNTFRMTLKALDSKNTVQKTFVSEEIELISDSVFSAGKWHTAEFYNSISDSEIDYSYGYRTKRNIPYIRPLKRISNSEITTEKLDNRIKKIDYKSLKVYQLTSDKLPYEYAATLIDCFNDSQTVKIDNVIYTTIGQAEIEDKGQWAIVKAQLAVSGMPNELGVLAGIQKPGESSATTGFYPVS